MKIAVQFYGHLRTYEKCAASIQKHLLSLYDCDVFMHTWSETEHQTKTWHQTQSAPLPVDEEKIAQLKKMYQLKDICVESQNTGADESFVSCRHNDGKSQISVRGIRYMLYSEKKVNALRQKYQKEHQQTYDYVLLIRPDIKLKKDFILHAVDREIRGQERLVRYAATGLSNPTHFPLIGNMASDIIFFGRPEVIDQALEILNKIRFEEHLFDAWTPEALFYTELENCGINSSFINYLYPKDWEIVRKADPKQIRHRIIRFRLKKNMLSLWLFSFLPFTIFSFKIGSLNFFQLIFCLGRKDDE